MIAFGPPGGGTWNSLTWPTVASATPAAASDTTMPTKMTQNAHTVSKPGKRTFMPKKPVINVSGSSTTENTVRMRNTSFWRCEMTDSFVSSSASMTSL